MKITWGIRSQTPSIRRTVVFPTQAEEGGRILAFSRLSIMEYAWLGVKRAQALMGLLFDGHTARGAICCTAPSLL